MSKDWYPTKLNVGDIGTRATYDFMKSVFSPTQHITYAEFGIYRADTAKNVCELFPNATMHLFDFTSAVEAAEGKLARYPNRKFFYGNTQKYNDSYNWSLMKLIRANPVPIFDYCFLDGAHTLAVDGLTFFLCDRLLRVGGYMDFDDYHWRLHGSSMDPSKVPEIADQYTKEQIETSQVAMIVDDLVKRDPRYIEMVPDKIYRKVSAT